VLPAFVIGLREGLETVVIIGAIAVFLRVRTRPDLLRRVWRATAVAAALCIVIAFVIRLIEVNLPWRQQEQLEAVVGLVAVVMVTYMIVWMRRFPKDLRRDTNAAAASALDSDAGRALVVLAFLAVLREGFEIAVFVIATIGMTRNSAWLATWGAVLGVLVALVVGVAVVRGSTRLDVGRFFRITALVLVVTAAGIAMATVHSANAAGWITFGQTPQYDLAWLAPPGSVLSSFTTGVLGLQPYPVLIEVITWIAYLVPMLAIVLWPSRGVSLSLAGTRADAAEAFDPTAPGNSNRRRYGVVASVAMVCLALTATGLALANHRGAKPPAAPRTVEAPKVLYATLNDVTCPSSTRCLAVGEFLPADKDASSGDPDGDGRASHTLVEASNGGPWRVASSPDEGKGGAVLSGVACASNDRCVAVGYYRPARFALNATSAPPNYPLIEAYDGRGWRLAPSPDAPPNSILTSVSCPSPTDCVAVGYTTTNLSGGVVDESPFSESLGTGGWKLTPTSSATGTSSGLSAVSCSSDSRCVAVGNVAPGDDPSTTMPLIEAFDGRHWSPMALPAVANGRGILYDVACTSDLCVAVGTSDAHRSSGAALVLSSSGTTWSADDAALEQPTDISLTTVACDNTDSCLVAGTSLASLDASPEKIFARVTATTWAKVDVAAKSATIEAMTCNDAPECLLVGSAPQNSFGNTNAIIASLSGGALATESTPTP
jgi:high-affinity iron transporter